MEKKLIETNPFEFNENAYVIACVGNNGGTYEETIRMGYSKTAVILFEKIVNDRENEDILVYPLIYCARHSIELGLKIIALSIKTICNKKKIDTDYNQLKSHDLLLLDKTIRLYYRIDKRIVEIYDNIYPLLKDYEFDKQGDAFKYRNNSIGNPHMSSNNIGSISLDLYMQKYGIINKYIEKLIRLQDELIYEYSQGTFTKTLSRELIKEISLLLPNKDKWHEPEFNKIKSDIKVKYKIGSKELSDAINIILRHREFSINIGDEIRIGNIAENVLFNYMFFSKEYTTLRTNIDNKISQKELYQNGNKIAGKFINSISKEELIILYTFSEITDYYSEEFDSLLSENEKTYVNEWDYKKIAERLLQRYVMVLKGLQKCGQKTYFETLYPEGG